MYCMFMSTHMYVLHINMHMQLAVLKISPSRRAFAVFISPLVGDDKNHAQECHVCPLHGAYIPENGAFGKVQSSPLPIPLSGRR
ncbi:hypothetical protein I7I50_11066 [Histoplasma capsulatum G186AR]|uniref:Uncharacterized protein n=1 Tax=Ajellomyces capsulatus TaxID=5037 RepID=A0A8H7Z954_AJECA|nr:hypothetical protein I7I52_02305 [Histoplasma capsulatum]QSS69690.1 hypothetical protein I7I50_11066 [Histoplasma capsulatum G186AR]